MVKPVCASLITQTQLFLVLFYIIITLSKICVLDLLLAVITISMDLS